MLDPMRSSLDPVQVLIEHLKAMSLRLDDVLIAVSKQAKDAPDVLRHNAEYAELLGKKDEQIIRLYKRIDDLEEDNRKLYDMAYGNKTVVYKGDGTIEKVV